MTILLTFQTSSFPSQKQRSMRTSLTWSMSCWLTTVSPLLKSILASEAKESRDRGHSQTIFTGVNPQHPEEPEDSEPQGHGARGPMRGMLLPPRERAAPGKHATRLGQGSPARPVCSPRDPVHAHPSQRLTPQREPWPRLGSSEQLLVTRGLCSWVTP